MITVIMLGTGHVLSIPNIQDSLPGLKRSRSAAPGDFSVPATVYTCECHQTYNRRIAETVV